jgi:hypothetical protein
LLSIKNKIIRLRKKNIKKSPRLCSLGLNPPKEEGGGDNRGKLRRHLNLSGGINNVLSYP